MIALRRSLTGVSKASNPQTMTIRRRDRFVGILWKRWSCYLLGLVSKSPEVFYVKTIKKGRKSKRHTFNVGATFKK